VAPAHCRGRQGFQRRRQLPKIVADVLEMEAVPHQAKAGLLLDNKVRPDFDALKATIKAGGK
jgi:hypothetical protein